MRCREVGHGSPTTQSGSRTPTVSSVRRSTGAYPSIVKQPHEGFEQHRNTQGGAHRAAIFGLSDGILTNVSLILALAGAGVTPHTVRLAGFASLLAGSFSMAAGEYVSMSAQRELLSRELAVERRAIARDPETEREELASIFREQGVSAATAAKVAGELMRDPESALRAHAREELGINPDGLGSPLSAAAASLISFALGALLPLLPWFLLSGHLALVAAVTVAVCAIGITGAGIGYLTGQSLLRGVARQVIIASIAGAVTYSIGRVLGVSTR